MHSYAGLLASVHHKVAAFSPLKLIKRGRSMKVIKRFADAVGLVYFGFVDQKDDEHHLVRGITASNTHRDSHYCLGSYQTYDVAMVVRRDSFPYHDKRIRHHTWTIMTFDLHTAYDVPDMFVAHSKKRELLLAKFSRLMPIMVGAHGVHDESFSKSYSVFAAMTDAVEAERFITPAISSAIPSVLGDMAIEVQENTVHLYVTNHHPTKSQLEKMLSAGVWLAEHFDYTARQLQIAEED